MGLGGGRVLSWEWGLSCLFVLICVFLCFFVLIWLSKHNISLLHCLWLTPSSLACGLLGPLAPASWLLYKLLEPLMLICAYLCLFVLICAYLCLFVLIWLSKHNISLLSCLWLTPSSPSLPMLCLVPLRASWFSPSLQIWPSRLLVLISAY